MRFLVLFHEKYLFQMLPDEEENTSYFTLSVEVSKSKSGKDEGALVWYNQMNQSPLPGDLNARKGTGTSCQITHWYFNGWIFLLLRWQSGNRMAITEVTIRRTMAITHRPDTSFSWKVSLKGFFEHSFPRPNASRDFKDLGMVVQRQFSLNGKRQISQISIPLQFSFCG